MSDYKNLTTEQIEVLWKVFHESLDIVLVKNFDGNFVYCNKAVAKLYNTTPEEMVGKDDAFFTGNREQSDFFRDNVREIMKQGETEVVYEDSTNAETGEVRNFKSIKIPYKNEKGEDNIIVIAQDITQERAKEREINFILSTLNVGTWRWNIVDNELSWNDTNYNVFGINKEDFSGAYEAWENSLDPDDKEQALIDLNDALEGKRDFSTTFGIITPKGERRYIGGKGEVFRDKDGSPLKMIGINWDRTEEYLAEKRYEEQKRITQHQNRLASIGELAAGVGHEVNNPLAIADGMLNRLWKTYQKDPHNSEKIEELYSKTNIALKRIAEIVKGLKTFSRADDSNFRHFNPVFPIEETLGLVKEIYGKEDIIIDYKNSLSQETMIYGAIGSFQQILMNLLSNAKDALSVEKNKRISIEVATIDNTFRLNFSDNGPGMDKPTLDRIFEPFYTTKDVSKGTGIGLSLVRNFIEDFGGKININSEVGKGTTFVVDIPIAKFSQKEEMIETTLDNKTENVFENKVNAIIVDDEEYIVEFITEYLKEMGIKSNHFSSAVEALVFYRSNKENIDLVISDIKMPVMDGLEFYDNLKNKEQYQRGFVFITGGINNIDIHERYKDEKNVSILEKPFNYNDLLLMIKKHL